MKILYLSDSAIPSYSANSIHVMKMCQAWANGGHDVTLVAKNTSASIKEVKDFFAFYDVEPIFKIRRFPSGAFPGSGRLYNLLLPFFGFITSDLAYTRAIYPAVWYSLFGKRIVFEIHEPFDTKSPWLAKLFRFVVQRQKIVQWVVISAPLKKYLIEKFNIAPEKVTIAHDGADPFHDEVSAMPLEGQLKIGYVGSLLKGKGMELLIPISKLLPEVTFHVVGGKPAEIQNCKNQLESGQNNVVFHGFKPHSETAAFIKSFDILIAPYLQSVYVKNQDNSNNIAQWMSPLKIFEYMSSGKPIVTTDLPVLREVLTDGVNALLCNAEHVEEWVHAIRRISDNKEFGTLLGNNARAEFLHHYTWLQRSQNILKTIPS